MKRTEKNTIENVILDLGNVLFCIEEQKTYTQLAALIDTNKCPSDWKNNYFIPHIHRYSNGEISTVLFVNGLIRYAKNHVQALDIIEVWNSMLLQLHPEALSFLCAHHNKYRLFLFSNINDLHYRKFQKIISSICSLEHFEGHFSKCYYSHLIGRSKPDVKAFEWVLEDAGIQPEQTLFVDDKWENTQGALQTGLQVLHLEQPCDFISIKNKLFKAEPE